MAPDISKSVFELFSGNKRARLLPTLTIAVIVTALVGIPLIVRAIDARDNPPIRAAETELVVVDTADADPMPLDDATVGGTILISYNSDSATGVAFNLFASGTDDPLIASQDLQGPQFDLILNERGTGSPLDSTLLEDGRYELFVTVSTPKGDERTALAFTVANS